MNSVKGKRVIDLGCGTGILSLFAATSGADHVTAIEETNISDITEKMIVSNKMSSKITLCKKNSKEVSLDKKADVLIHEIIGSDPFDENIIEYVFDAKKRLLNKSAILIPGRLQVCCVAFEEENIWNYLQNESQTFENLYDLSFTPYINAIEQTPADTLRSRITPSNNNYFGKKILSRETLMYDVDFYKEFDDSVLRKKVITVNFERDGLLSGILIYFKAYLSEGIVLNTSPYGPPTSWLQKENLFGQARYFKKGASVKLELEVKKVGGADKIQVNAL
jgi:16S rRNA G966 N2-methylase RsmD